MKLKALMLNCDGVPIEGWIACAVDRFRLIAAVEICDLLALDRSFAIVYGHTVQR